MRSLIALVITAVVVMMFSGQVFAQTVTGCVDAKGGLKNVAVGDSPLSPCGQDQTQVTLGAQGLAGQDGADGTYLKEVILGPSGITRDGSMASMANSDCRFTFGPGARWANTKDLKELSWDPGSGFARGWVDPYPVSRDEDGTILDISGSSGTVEELACGITNLNNLGVDIVWAATFGVRLGMSATRAVSTPLFFTCDVTDIQTLCVGPEPQP